MGEAFGPDIEFDWRPTLWAAGVMIAVGLIGNFVFMQPSWLGYSAFLAGVVASFRSGYYDPSANSAAVGVLLGVLILTPVIAYTRVVFMFGVDNAGDQLFNTVALSAGWLLVVIMVLVPLGYIGAAVSDFTRKKVGGPIGF